MADMPNLPPPVAGDWIPLGEVFRALTHFYGDPEEALHDIRRSLLRGKVRSLRRRILDGAWVGDVELDRIFWQDIRLLPYRDEQGRYKINLLPKPGIKLSWDKSDPRYGIFYLHRADCIKAWPRAVEPEKSASEATIRREITQVYEQASADCAKPPNINELADLVRLRIHERGLKISRARIKKIGKEEEFERLRWARGQRR